MAYSKRWELIHILGGKCKKCGEENFKELEIDHIHNDGDLERLYYTRMDERYISNHMRARQRLQILCKKCHDIKHKPTHTSPTEIKRRNMELFLLTLKELEHGNDMVPVPDSILIEHLIPKLTVNNEDEARQYIRLMLRQASIYESIPEHYNTV